MSYKYKIEKEYSMILERVNYVVYEKSFIFWHRVDHKLSEERANKLIDTLKEMRNDN